MSLSPLALIVRAPGTNCDVETAHAFQLAGARVETVYLPRILERPGLLDAAQIFCIPGGFSYGDDIAAGRIFARHLTGRLEDSLLRFRDRGHLILAICNGFQVMLQSSLLIQDNVGGTTIATLTHNESTRFEARWVRLRVGQTRSVFLQGLETLELPVAHAEGRFAVASRERLAELRERGQCALHYATNPQTVDEAQGMMRSPGYPANPNGSVDDLAGLSDVSGHVLGLMPHPERFVDPTQHPEWTRRRRDLTPDGLSLFQNAVRYFA
ncbi:MAG TPA: phosphoribosylformylglycinamidine synthase subunit PurQ [Pirellulaceae bacterium]